MTDLTAQRRARSMLARAWYMLAQRARAAGKTHRALQHCNAAHMARAVQRGVSAWRVRAWC
eukprot:9015244-Lingulodinium_polyedra.AAC.1